MSEITWHVRQAAAKTSAKKWSGDATVTFDGAPDDDAELLRLIRKQRELLEMQLDWVNDQIERRNAEEE